MGAHLSRRLPGDLLLPARSCHPPSQEKRATATDEGPEQADADVPGNGYTQPPIPLNRIYNYSILISPASFFLALPMGMFWKQKLSSFTSFSSRKIYEILEKRKLTHYDKKAFLVQI